MKKQSYLLSFETPKLLLDNIVVVIGGVRWWGGVRRESRELERGRHNVDTQVVLHNCFLACQLLLSLLFFVLVVVVCIVVVVVVVVLVVLVLVLVQPTVVQL